MNRNSFTRLFAYSSRHKKSDAENSSDLAAPPEVSYLTYDDLVLKKRQGSDPDILYFDSAWYLKTYPESAEFGADPIKHFLEIGQLKNFSPHPTFDAEWYYRRYSDVAASPFTAARHFLLIGYKENRWPNPLFDPAWYKNSYEDLLPTGDVNLIFHYLNSGESAGFLPHPLFEPSWYKERYNIAIEVSALTHFLTNHKIQDLDPHPLFDVSYYVAENPDVKIANIEPLEHFFDFGGLECRRHSPAFDQEYYVSLHPDVSNRREIPVVNFLTTGDREMRDPHSYFNTEWYKQQWGELIPKGQTALVHFLINQTTHKVQSHPSPVRSRLFLRELEKADLPLDSSAVGGLVRKAAGFPRLTIDDLIISPTQNEELEDAVLFFDAAWYQDTYANALSPGDDPLEHFLSVGQDKNYSPHPLLQADWYISHTKDAEAQFGAAVHFLKQGWKQDRKPNPLFDSAWYCEQYEAMLWGSDPNPVFHYLSVGEKSGCSPHPLFDQAWYRSRYGIDFAENCLAHFFKFYKKQDLDPHPLLDLSYYRFVNTDVWMVDADPLCHFFDFGGLEGRDHTPAFDSKAYLSAYPDVRQKGEIPVVDYLKRGDLEGRNPDVNFETQWYRSRWGSVIPRNQNALVHCLLARPGQKFQSHPSQSQSELFHGKLTDFDRANHVVSSQLREKPTAGIVILMVTHVLGGGTQTYVSDLSDDMSLLSQFV